MVNATPPKLPSYDDDVLVDPLLRFAELDKPVPFVDKVFKRFARQWYDFFHSVFIFERAIRNAPLQLAQAEIAKFTARLSGEHAGIQAWVAEPFNHLLRFDGKQWTFAPGDLGSDYYVTGIGAGLGVGFHAADGATVDYLLGTGEIGSRVLSTAADTWYRQ
jgi:hypothetical protein